MYLCIVAYLFCWFRGGFRRLLAFGGLDSLQLDVMCCGFVIGDVLVLLWLVTIVWCFAFCRMAKGWCGLLLVGRICWFEVCINSVVAATITHSLFVRSLNVGFQLF